MVSPKDIYIYEKRSKNPDLSWVTIIEASSRYDADIAFRRHLKALGRKWLKGVKVSQFDRTRLDHPIIYSN